MNLFRSFCVAVALTCAASPCFAQSKATATNVPEIPYDSVPNFFKMPPTIYFGEGIGVATNSKGHVFVYTRSGDTRLFEFDQNGTYVREIGNQLGHALEAMDDTVRDNEARRDLKNAFNALGSAISSTVEDAATAIRGPKGDEPPRPD
jgi:hypothetical protein